MSKQTALIVDDESDLIDLVSMALQQMNINSMGATNLSQARELLKTHEFNFVLTDMQLPDGDGLELVREIQIDAPYIPVAVITAHGSMEKAVESLKAGAFDYVAKPLEIDMLRRIVEQASRLNSTMRDIAAISEEENPDLNYLNQVLIGESLPMQTLKDHVIKVAKSQAPIFIWGESGTGKEVVARSIHHLSSRSKGPFVAVNCGAIPADLIESELFGHKKGSFSGAIQDKEGLFSAADGGTLFLDEVADIPLAMQVKLLRVIQEKKLRPVGSTQEHTIDCRLLSATHKNLDLLVHQNKFRDDLYYRINVIQLAIPPLRDRGHDSIILAKGFLASICKEMGRTPVTLSHRSERLLLDHSFEGNVRELQNALQRACTLCENTLVEPEHLKLYGMPSSRTKMPEDPNLNLLAREDIKALPSEAEGSKSKVSLNPYDPDSMSLEDYLQYVEGQAIRSVLEETHWNRTAAAKRLGLSFRSLRYRLKKLGLED